MKSGSVERRLFLLAELTDCTRKGRLVPGFARRKILRHPSEAEDYVNFLRFIKPEENIFLIDIGANVGLWLEEFLAWFPNTEAIAIEPARESFEALSSRYKGDARVTPVHAGLSNQGGKAQLRVTCDSTLNSLEVYAPEFAAYRHDETRELETVQLVRLDDIAPQTRRSCRVLKLDVQGHEIEALEGATQTLKSIDLALCELSFVNEFVGKPPSFARVTTLMAEAGLFPVIFQEYGKRISNHRLECDVVYVRRERFEELYLASKIDLE
jgi:FkbM family methyltransferase